MVERISTGIKQLDKMMESGFPRQSIIGIRGPAGVGKTLYALHFILEGARRGEKCVYINLEEPRSNIENVMETMDWGDEFLELEKKKKIRIVCMDYMDFESLFTSIFKSIAEDKKIKRVAIDSFNGFFSLYTPSVAQGGKSVREMLSHAFTALRRDDLTTVVTLEKSASDGVSELVAFKADGLIELDYISFGNVERRIFISKMRWTNQHGSSLVYDITKNGIDIRPEEEH